MEYRSIFNTNFALNTMPPRIRICERCLRTSQIPYRILHQTYRYASVQAITQTPSFEQMTGLVSTVVRYPSTQPPSHKPPEYRKSQLHRQYTSLLRSTPLMLLFQHNNLKATEWVGVRRELTAALRKVDQARRAAGHTGEDLADAVKFQIIRSGIFEAALRVVEFFDSDNMPRIEISHHSNPTTRSSASLPIAKPTPDDPAWRHGLSRTAYKAAANKKMSTALEPLLSGPLAVVTFPVVNTGHLKTVLSMLAPQAPQFPAPTRRANPGYHDAAVQAGVQKLLLLGARVEGKVFDLDGTRWVGTIEGGLDGLRGQLVALLQGIGAGLTNTLESAGRSLYLTVESRRKVLEDQQDGGKKESEENGSTVGS